MRATKEQLQRIIEHEKSLIATTELLRNCDKEKALIKRVSKAYIKALQLGHDVRKSHLLCCKILNKRLDKITILRA